MPNPKNKLLRDGLLLFGVMLGFSAYAAEPQRLIIDEEHRQFIQHAKKAPLRYELAPGDRLLLDATAYKFKPAEGDDDAEPNAVQLILDKDHQYNTAWDNETHEVLLSPATLIGRTDSFKGLKSGDTFVLVIGRQVVDEVKQEGFFRVQWVGMGSVK